MSQEEIESKLKYLLMEISKAKRTEGDLIELLENASFRFEKHWNNSQFPNAYNLELAVTPDVYTKNYYIKDVYTDIIKLRINDISKLIIDKLKILPDYEKLQVIHSNIFLVVTEWDEVNDLQQKLIDNLKTATLAVDFQAIGLISRTIMEKLSRNIFKPEIHRPKDEKISVADGNFKNQLHTYIDSVLSGESNRRFRNLAKSSIDFVEDSIDFMNKTTHDLNADKQLAEVCIISTISALSILKLVKKIE